MQLDKFYWVNPVWQNSKLKQQKQKNKPDLLIELTIFYQQDIRRSNLHAFLNSLNLKRIPVNSPVQIDNQG